MTGPIYTDVVPAEPDQPSGNGVTLPNEAPQGASGISGQQNPFAGMGELLEEQDDSKVFQIVHDIVKRQEPIAKNREAQAKHWGRVRRGIPFSQLTKSEDRAEWRAELPEGISDQTQPVPNKADDLCSRITSQVTVDPYLPDPKPENDNDAARHAAELSKKWLTSDGDETGTNDAETFRDALDRSHTKASAFAFYWLDEKGDGWRPLQIMAAPDAVDPNNPLIGSNGMPSPDTVLRYVGQGQFVDSPGQADRQWLPKIRGKVLNPANVRTVPVTSDVSHASAVILLMCEALGEARRMLPELAEMDAATLNALAAWRPVRPKVLVPESLKGQFNKAEKADQSVSDDTLIFWYWKFCEPGSDYPDGAEIAVSGANGGLVVRKATLRDDIEEKASGMPAPDAAAPSPTSGAKRPVLRTIPVSQMKVRHDSEMGDPFGRTTLETFAGPNEAYAQVFGGVLELIDQLLHPNVFIPSTSTVQDWQLTSRTGSPIPVLSKEDMPFYEEPNQLPTFTPQILEELSKAADNAAGTGETARGLEVSTSVSGKAKELAIQQAKVAMSQVYQNFAMFVKRCWRIKLQLAQCKLTIPQQIEQVGTDSAYKQRYWTGADFVGVKSVAIQAGTGTMMSPQEKQQYLTVAQQFQWLDPEEAAEVGRSTLADDLGLQDNPHEERINRDLALWGEGPPEGWAEQYAAFQAQNAQYQQIAGEYQAVAQQAQAAGQQPPQAPQMAQPQQPWSPFEPRASDDDPVVAKTRHRVLREFMSTGDYAKWPAEWRSLVDQVYLQARQAAGVMSIAEQQQMQMQAQAQAMAMKADPDQGTEQSEQPAARAA